jgi:putative RecB family exonuclease
MRVLSKSQINVFKQCPKKWYYNYIKKIKSKPSEAMFRGIRIHKEIEDFYNNITIDIPNKKIKMLNKNTDLKEFLKFENKRLQSCFDKDGNLISKYFYPFHQEAKVNNKELALRGFIDAVYINPEDGKLIIIDWKTGKFRPDSYSSYRFELAMYKELYEKQYGGEVGYWGIFFVDAGKLFFEKVKPISIKAMYKSIERARIGMESGEYPCKPSVLCQYCDYRNICEEWK